MRREELVDAFLTVAEEQKLHACRREARHFAILAQPHHPAVGGEAGGPPAHRTTRSVAPTEAGERLLGTLTPALQRDGREVRVRSEGQIICNNVNTVVRAAVSGFGLAFVMEDRIQEHLASGRLVQVLDEWCPSFPGYHLY